MNSLEQTSHVIKLLSLLEKEQPKVKPLFAKKYGFEWDNNKKCWTKLVGV